MDQTLHDFVLNLLTDADARSAFDLDPEGALQAAGLTDITAADVQDVVPLVVDYAPVGGLAPVAPLTGQLGADPLVNDATDVVGQLQSVAQQITVSSTYSGVDVKAGVLGAIAVDPTAVAVGATVLPGIGVGVGPGGIATDLTGVNDVAHTLDADVVGVVDTVADPVVGDVTGAVGAPDTVLDATDHGLLGTPDGLLGGTLSGTTGQVGGLVDSLGVNDTLGGLGLNGGDAGSVGPVDVPSTVGGVTHQVDGVLSGVTGTVGSVTGGVTGGVTGDAGVHGDASASHGGGLLGITDGLL
ncbi:IniB N-terminal domain-containing protein [Micromonospora sp. WMMD812]|uniref:IniB N-terminal domain-containing protein n=1 Tax=Micromonospora sp. WMMD812 TaxID=3015152 RepID=UPI00248BC265|nr:IniB N-terminal domain-containing protein [Micromonospora sp. WMMD812]WBB65150.1 IniB N-terminal domain-containing protein [Micromonospora sp. WMMD812]